MQRARSRWLYNGEKENKMTHSIFWGAGNERPMVISSAGHEVVVPYDDAIQIAGNIGKEMGISAQEVVQHFLNEDHLEVTAGFVRLLADDYPDIDFHYLDAG